MLSLLYKGKFCNLRKLFILLISYKIIFVLLNVINVLVLGLKSIKFTSFSCWDLLLISIRVKLFVFIFKFNLNTILFLVQIITIFSPVKT